ncbi:conserved hypothetical protein [Paraburkholderia tropica]|uniref:DUF4123 domain-containing protein n=1 Tax=Paraburkholderia tropica TaxID=92647 RepID=UPI001CAF90A8|nr:DUF4123 domain-containing protein [Paraburkholderia tropica]CAG9191917.1 conserved hypothetical protein [Paraburkholderia tropica]
MTLLATSPENIRSDVRIAPRLLWIFDGGLEPELEAILRKHDHRLWFTWVYSGTEYAHVYSEGPLLVESRADSPLLDAFISSWAAAHWGGLLLSAAPFETVLNHLRALKHAQLPDGTTSLLRLHEPRALRGFAQGADAYTLNTLLGPIDHWYWCEWNEGQGDWYRLDHPAPGHGVVATDSPNVSTALLDALDGQRIDYRNRGFARRLRAANIPMLRDADDALLAQAVQKHAAEAPSRGFVSDDDVYGFLEVYFRYHRQLFEPSSRLADVMAAPDVPAWRRLQQAHALMEETSA